MIPLLLWILILEFLGWITWPLAARLLRWLPDRGYTASKALGLLLTSYLLWLGASTGFLNNDLGGILAAILATGLLSGWVFYRYNLGSELRLFLRERKTLILVAEILFIVAFAAWAGLRAYAPEKIMNAGGEKFMEIAFLNAILNSPHFPPLDPWLSGFAISYYYFGYVMMALLTRLSGVPSGVGFDLYDALLFALTALGVFGVVYNLVAIGLKGRAASQPSAGQANQPIAYGLLGSLLVVVMSNLEGLLEALHSRGALPQSFFTWLNVPDLAKAPVSGSWFPGAQGGWWWWRASRVIQDLDLNGKPLGISPITEFPFFSFLLGDNHPHVLALPFVLLAIALALNLLQRQTCPEAGEQASESKPRIPWWNPIAFSLEGDGLLFLVGSVLLGGLAFLNTWDFPIYLGVVLLAYAGGRFWLAYQPLKDVVARTLVLGAGLGIASILLYIFFYAGFSSQAGGILPYIFPPTRLPQYLVMFGPFLLIIAGFTAAYFWTHSQPGGFLAAVWVRLKIWVAVMFAGVALVTLFLGGIALGSSVLSAVKKEIASPAVSNVLGGLAPGEALRVIFADRLQDPWLFLAASFLIALALACAAWALPRAVQRSGDPTAEEASSDLFAFILILVGLALTWSVEFVYLRDSFGARMNTVFKFYYQGWIMMGCASGYALWWLASAGRRLVLAPVRFLIQGGATLLILAGMVYPVMAGYSRAQGFRGQPNLDGASGIARANPDDWAAIQWLKDEAAFSGKVPTLLEAPGASYNYEGRISAFTGFPTVLGWYLHEGQWRGSYVEQDKRQPDIATIYTTSDPNLALELLRKWDVDYVIVGATEQGYIQKLCTDATRHCNLMTALRKFDASLKQVFTQGSIIIYAVP